VIVVKKLKRDLYIGCNYNQNYTFAR